MTQFPTQPKYLVSGVEHALVFDRPNGELINFSLEHCPAFGPIPVSVVYRYDDPAIPDEHGVEYFGSEKPSYELSLAIFDQNRDDDPDPREQITLSYQEARLLRDLLNKPEVVKLLDQHQ